MYICKWNKNCPVLIAFVSSASGISSLLLMFDTQNRREPGSGWTCRLHQAGGSAAMGHPALCFPTQ